MVSSLVLLTAVRRQLLLLHPIPAAALAFAAQTPAPQVNAIQLAAKRKHAVQKVARLIAVVSKLPLQAKRAAPKVAAAPAKPKALLNA